MKRSEQIGQAALDYMCKCNMSFIPDDTHETTFIEGAIWADNNPKSTWHSVADGDLPKTKHDTRYLLDGITCENAYIATDGKEWWVDFWVPMYNSWASQSTPTHWMEIPQLPKPTIDE